MRAPQASSSHDRVLTAVVIDRDAAHAAALSSALTRQGFAVFEVYDGKDGVDAVRTRRPDLITVEVDLPGMDGFETVRRIRQLTSGAVVMVTEHDAETAIVEGFRSGADDYVLKPFAPFALRARIEALLRRTLPMTDWPRVAPEASWIQHGPIQVHVGSRRVQVHGVDRSLTRSEFDILAALMRAHDQVFSKADLALVLRDSIGIAGQRITSHDEHAVEVHVMNLRRKISGDPRGPQWIETVRGLGYRLAPLSDVQLARVHAPIPARPIALHVAVG